MKYYCINADETWEIPIFKRKNILPKIQKINANQRVKMRIFRCTWKFYCRNFKINKSLIELR